MRTVGKVEYETSWNYKYSFETGNEVYHHAGLHAKRIMEFAPPQAHEVLEFGEIWGIYGGKLPAQIDTPEFRMPLRRPAWMTVEEANKSGAFWSLFIAVYPGLITYISPHQLSMLTPQHVSMDKNIAASHISVPQWALDNPNDAPIIEFLVQSRLRAASAEGPAAD